GAAFSTPEDLCRGIALFNPHAAVRYNGQLIRAPVPLKQRWTANKPTSPHWYGQRQLCDLVAAHLKREREEGDSKPRLLRAFIGNFHGLTGNLKTRAVLESVGLVGRRLTD